MSVSLIVERLEKLFGRFPALRGVSLDVEPGELVALLGPSGSGKTTLLRLIAGLEDYERGAITFDGIDTRELSLAERRIGFVFQNYALFQHMNVFENIAYGLRVRPRKTRPTNTEITRRVNDLLDLMQLPGLAARFPSQLSGGQRQRVALARALAIEPRILLLDEPFGALDAQVRKDLRRWLRELHARTGHTTLFVTHDQEEALELADRVAILREGRIEQVGTPQDVYDHPATPFVCEFLGETNKLPVNVTGGEAFLGDKPILGGLGRNWSGAASLYVRPQHLKLADETGLGFQGHVARVRTHGAFRRLEVVVTHVPAPVDVEVPAGIVPERGERVRLKIANAHIFQNVA